MEKITQKPYAKVLQNFNIILHVEVFITLYFFICMAVLSMCLQREGSEREILNFVMQANAQVGFKNIMLIFSNEKFLGYESWSTSLNILLRLILINDFAKNKPKSKPFNCNRNLSFNYFLTDVDSPQYILNKIYLSRA